MDLLERIATERKLKNEKNRANYALRKLKGTNKQIIPKEFKKKAGRKSKTIAEIDKLKYETKQHPKFKKIVPAKNQPIINEWNMI